VNGGAVPRDVLACGPIDPAETRTVANPLLLPMLEWARRLRYPTLFKITAGLFALSVLLPPGIDPIPFLDELVFGLGTLLLANWKRRKDPAPPLEPGRPSR